MAPEHTDRKGMAAAAAALVALLLALAILLDLGPFSDELSVAEFIAQGDEICSQAHDSFRDLQRGAPRTPEEAAELTGALIDSAVEELEEMQALGAPASLAGQLERYYGARERGIEVLRKGLDAARDEHALAYERTQADLAGSQTDRFATAREIGFSVCSKPLVDAEELRRQAEPPAGAGLDAPPEVNNRPARPTD